MPTPDEDGPEVQDTAPRQAMSVDQLPGRLTILDPMVVVAVVAASFAGARTLLSLQLHPASWAVAALWGSLWIVLAPTLGLIPARLIRLRADRDRLWRRPGWVACFAVTLALAISIVEQLLSLVFLLIRRPGAVRGEMLFREVSFRLPQQAVFAVAAAWAVLALGGWWESDRTRIDRLGWLFGLYWLAFPLVSWFVEVMSIG